MNGEKIIPYSLPGIGKKARFWDRFEYDGNTPYPWDEQAFSTNKIGMCVLVSVGLSHFRTSVWGETNP